MTDATTASATPPASFSAVRSVIALMVTLGLVGKETPGKDYSYEQRGSSTLGNLAPSSKVPTDSSHELSGTRAHLPSTRNTPLPSSFRRSFARARWLQCLKAHVWQADCSIPVHMLGFQIHPLHIAGGRSCGSCFASRR